MSEAVACLDAVLLHRSRFFRDCCRIALEANSEVRIVGMYAEWNSFIDEGPTFEGDALLFEVASVPTSLSEFVGHLRTDQRRVLVGFEPGNHKIRSFEGLTCLRETCTTKELVGALYGQLQPETSFSGLSVSDNSQFRLTKREFEILILIARGFTTVEIGRRLRLSRKTIESRRESLFSKLGVQNQSHAVAVALNSGLLDGIALQPASS